MKVLVTGATGFLGRAIVGELLQNNFKVFTTGKSPRADDLPNYFPADISDIESLKRLQNLGEIDAVIHSAALAHQFGKTARASFWKVNVEGTRSAVNLSLKLKAGAFILISSVSVYGAARRENSSDVFEEERICRPEGFYAESKLESERAAREICAKNKIKLNILRPSTIVGENDRGNVSRLIEAIDKRRFFWIGNGTNLKSLIYKADVARVCRLLLENSGKPEFGKTNIYNVTAEPVSMREIVEEIEKSLKKTVLPVHLPAIPLLKTLKLLEKISGIKKIAGLSATVGKWLSDDVFSGEKIKTQIGFVPEVSPLEGVRREVLFYRKQK